MKEFSKEALTEATTSLQDVSFVYSSCNLIAQLVKHICITPLIMLHPAGPIDAGFVSMPTQLIAAARMRCPGAQRGCQDSRQAGCGDSARPGGARSAVC